MLSTAEVEHLADLAKLELSDEEKEKYARELSGILTFVEQLNGVTTDGVLPTSQVTGLVGGAREDVVKECNAQTRRRLIDAAPQQEGESVKVPAVFV